MVKISIITVTINSISGLQKTIESVVGQTYAEKEYIIIDGGSIDGSVDLIKEYGSKISYWLS
jgi:glycosyltransferase involved in cell wall biosynthesis